jgi:hypothetical protein
MLDSGLMAYAKCVLVGLMTGIGAAIVYGIAKLLLPFLPFWFSPEPEGGGLNLSECRTSPM